jgi:hypothetical protein
MNAVGRISAYLKGPLAKNIHRLFSEYATAFLRADAQDVAQMQLNAARMDEAVAQGNTVAIAFRNTTVRPYADSALNKIMTDRVFRGIESAREIEKLTDDDTHSAITHINTVLNRAVHYTNEMTEIKTTFDAVMCDARFTFLRALKFPIKFSEHANQCVYGFTSSTKQFKEENGLSATKQLFCFMNLRQLNHVNTFATSFLNQLVKDNAAGVEITQAHVNAVSQKKRDRTFETSQDMNVDRLMLDDKQNPIDVQKNEKRNLATGCRLGKSSRIYDEMPDTTDAEKKKKNKRECDLKSRFQRVSGEMKIV